MEYPRLFRYWRHRLIEIGGWSGSKRWGKCWGSSRAWRRNKTVGKYIPQTVHVINRETLDVVGAVHALFGQHGRPPWVQMCADALHHTVHLTQLLNPCTLSEYFDRLPHLGLTFTNLCLLVWHEVNLGLFHHADANLFFVHDLDELLHYECSPTNGGDLLSYFGHRVEDAADLVCCLPLTIVQLSFFRWVRSKVLVYTCRKREDSPSCSISRSTCSVYASQNIGFSMFWCVSPLACPPNKI